MNEAGRTLVVGEMEGVEAPARFTIDEFMTLVDTGVFEGWNVELEEGIIVRMNSNLAPHTFYRHQILMALNNAYGRAPGNLAAYSELTLRLGEATLRDADIGVTEAFGPDIDYVDIRKVLLVVEVSHTTLAYDLGNKARDYARNGIPHYWVVDVTKRRTLVMENPANGQYGAPEPVAFGQPIPLPGTDETIVIS